jgi:hypothetical protein
MEGQNGSTPIAWTLDGSGYGGVNIENTPAITCSLCATDAHLLALTTALGSPFQAGGSIGNSAFGISGTGLTDLNTIAAGSTDVLASGSIASGTANAAYTVSLANGEATTAFRVTGLTASGATLTVESTSDGGTNWYATNEINSAGTMISTITADGQFRFNTAGRTGIRLRVSSTGSGSISVASVAQSKAGAVKISDALPPFGSPPVVNANYTLTSTGFQQVASFSASTGFTPPALSTVCFVQAEGNNVRFRTDGSAPTSTIGQLFPTGVLMTLTANLSGIRFIPVTGSATLDVDCYK